MKLTTQPTAPFSLEEIAPLRQKLKQHPVYTMVRDLEDLKVFMSCHVYSVWDFMSLVKAVQHKLAPSGPPWHVMANPMIQRFINEIVLEEETDQGLPDAEGNPTFISHFELYCQAMDEVGADSSIARGFSARVRLKGFDPVIREAELPQPSKNFMNTTFSFLKGDRVHEAAAAFALGREHIIPLMFRALLEEMQITPEQAPAFHYYLERHIHLDQDHHGPLSLMVLTDLCEGSPRKIEEARKAAIKAIQARIDFWDGVAAILQRKRAFREAG